MSCHYRCSKCRTRNVWPKALGEYKRGRKCRHCGYEKFYVDKERVSRKPCRCEGGLISMKNGAIPHRPGSPCCVQNKKFEFNRAIREGLDADDIAWHEIGAVKHQPGAECPF
jgi:hypothetical protein